MLHLWEAWPRSQELSGEGEETERPGKRGPGPQDRGTGPGNSVNNPSSFLYPVLHCTLAPWTTTSLTVNPSDGHRLIIGTSKFPQIIVHTQLLAPRKTGICVTNPHAYPVDINEEEPIALALPVPWIDKDWEESKSDPAFVAWTQAITETRPQIEIEVEGRKIVGLLDTGADVSVIAQKDWDQQWELEKIPLGVMGVGGGATARKSLRWLNWRSKDSAGKFRPFRLPLPSSLWGRDVLGQMGVVVTTDIQLNH